MASTIPLRITSDLVHQARNSAAILDRSPTAQIEHWARLGRVVEAVLSGDSIVRIKETKRVPDMEALVKLTQSPGGQRKAQALISKYRLPVYESDPNRPKVVVERQPDGTTRKGRFVNRKFVPEKEHA